MPGLLIRLMLTPIEPICFGMARSASLAVALATASLAIGAASPLAAQSSDQKQANSQPRIVNVPGYGAVYVVPVPSEDVRSVARVANVPGYGDVYVVPVRPKDSRSPRQRCLDEGATAEGGPLSALARGALDLKCSQR